MTKDRAADLLSYTKTTITEILAGHASLSDEQIDAIERSTGKTAGQLAMDSGEIDDPKLLELINGWAEFAALEKVPAPKKARAVKSRAI
jgi:hypothetical protein